MASLILGGVGSIAGGPLGGALGSLIGGYLDSNFIMPWLFPQDDIHGPRITEIKLQTQDEGSPANFVVGGTPRVAGTIIWISDIIEEEHEEEVDGGGKGGGGGGGAKVIKHLYFVHIAIAVAIGQIASVKKIFADGKVLYDEVPDLTLGGSTLAVVVLGQGSKRRMKITSPSGGPNLGLLHTNVNVVVSGFADANDNGTFKCLDSHKDTALDTSYCILKNNQCVAEAAGAAVSLFQDLPNFDTNKVEAITFYTGGASQAPDPLIESFKGTGNVPGYRGTSYVLLQKLALEDYGNRPPLLQFLLSSSTTTVSGAVAALMLRSGRSSADYDVSTVTGNLGGYALQGPQSMGQALQPLLLAYNLLTQETNGVVKFFPRNTAPVIDIPSTALSAHEGGSSENSRPLEVSEIPNSELPSEVNVKYVDLERDDLAGSERERRRDFLTDGVLNVELPLVFNSKQARAIVRRLLWTAWANRKPVKLHLPPSYIYVQENDVLRLKAMNESWLLLVQRTTMGHNAVIEIEALVELREVLTQLEEGDPPPADSGPVGSETPVVESHIWESGPLMPPAQNPAGGLTIHGGAASFSPQWTGATMFVSDDDEEWVSVVDLLHQATIGNATSTLGGVGVSPFVWDRVSTVTVELVHGSLATRPEDDVLNGLNRAKIGNEIIGYATATLVGAGTYTLSNLLRGLRNTEDKIATHAADEPFINLTFGGIVAADLNVSYVGSPKFFRVVPGGGNIEDVASTAMTLTGLSLRPFSPASVTKRTATNGDITLTWARRSRAITRVFSPLLPPLAEESESYDVEVWYPSGGGGSLIQSWSDVTTPTQAWPVGEHGAVPAGASVDVRVYQNSVAFGRGLGLVATV